MSYIEWYSQFTPHIELTVESRLKSYLESDKLKKELARDHGISVDLDWKGRLKEIYNKDSGLNIIPLDWWDDFLSLFLNNVFLQQHFAEVTNGFAIAKSDSTCMAKVTARKLIEKQ